MKQAFRKELKDLFEPPEPLYKKEFLRQLEQPKISTFQFVCSQTGYIRKWIWAFSALVFAVSAAGVFFCSLDMLWGISAFTPLLALTVLSESGRSGNYGMEELEMATRFSLRSVILGRLGILGTGNGILLCLLLPIGIWNSMISPIRAGVYIVTPFLLTAFSGLWIVRKFKGREAVYFCMGIAACVSFSVFFSHMTFPQIYQGDYFAWWIAGGGLLFLGTAKQCCNMINRTEEFVWSL